MVRSYLDTAIKWGLDQLDALYQLSPPVPGCSQPSPRWSGEPRGFEPGEACDQCPRPV